MAAVWLRPMLPDADHLADEIVWLRLLLGANPGAATDPLAHHVDDHLAGGTARVQMALDRLGVLAESDDADRVDRDHEEAVLLALLDGLVLQLCLGRRTPAEARALLARHLDGLVTAPR